MSETLIWVGIAAAALGFPVIAVDRLLAGALLWFFASAVFAVVVIGEVS